MFASLVNYPDRENTEIAPKKTEIKNHQPAIGFVSRKLHVAFWETHKRDRDVEAELDLAVGHTDEDLQRALVALT